MQQSRLFPTQGRAFRLFLLGGLSIILIACAWPVGQPTLTPTISTSTETSSPTTTQTNTRIFPTTTPFPPTATFSPVVTSTRIPFSTRTPTQILPGVRFPETPVPIIRPPSYPAGQVRILLLGADFRGGDTYRTDSILLLSLNPQNGTASLLSLPPALYVNIPEIGMERLNSAITFGGAGKVMDTIQYNLGIRPDKFFLIDMNNFLKVIQYLGTINVYSSTEMTDRCDLPQSINGYCTINKGFHQMDKDTALWYARSTIGGEQSRMLRSHEILSAIFSGLMNINAPERVGELFSTFQNNVETDMTTADLRALIPLSNLLLNPERVRRYTFTAEEAVPFTLPGGEKVLLLDQNAAWSLIQFAVFQP